jgi:hypothetical protein
MSVAGTKEGLNAGGRTKEDDQESEEKKSGWRLHFPLPVPTACKDVGKRKADFDTAPIRKRDFARTLN